MRTRHFDIDSDIRRAATLPGWMHHFHRRLAASLNGA